MSSLREIEEAISSLSSEDQATLVSELPSLLTAVEGQLAWLTSSRDATPVSEMTMLTVSEDDEASQNVEAVTEIIEADFELGVRQNSSWWSRSDGGN